MSLFSSQRSAAPLTENEKIMILNAHKYFSEENSSSKKRQKFTLRKRVAEVLGVSESTVGRVIHKWNECKNGSFAEQKNIGRPRLQPSPDIITLLREKITNANKAGTPVSTPILRQYLAENGFTLSKWKLLRLLHTIGYYYGHGERRNILHESPNNVSFRCQYIRSRLSNLQGNNDIPNRPEVFLDESYCHLHHTSPNTWVPHQGVVLAPGRGPLLVIFGAIVVFRNGNHNKTYGEIVPNSIYIWDPAIKPQSSRGRKRSNLEAWDNIPDILRDTAIVPDQIDYHGNFNAEIFESLFTKLCATVEEKYGGVDIHMDVARYHKRRIENIPTSASKKSEIIDWLSRKEVVVPIDAYKAELLELVRQNKEKVPFACVEIAKQHGHRLFFTPPYHCELQPIEGVWAVVKGEVARSGPHKNLLEIRNKLLWAFKEKVNSKVIVGLWKRALNNAKDYRENDEHVYLSNEETDDESFSEDNMESSE